METQTGTSIDPAAALWLDYKHRQDPEARERLIIEHLPLVRHIAGRVSIGLPASVDVDDLISYGVFGLLDAIEKYDVRRGIKFETYAYARIKGAMIDGLRAMDWAPQSLRKKGRALSEAYARLEAQLGRSAEDHEVAAELGISVEELHALLGELSQISLLSLEDLLYQDDEHHVTLKEMLADDEAVDPLEQVAVADLKKRLILALERLPQRERLIISLYYYEGLTVKEIGAVLGLSASRISQLHTRAIFRLRGLLQSRRP